MENLINSRDLLNSTLHKSRQIESEIHKTSNNLSRIHQSLESAASLCATLAMRDHVHRTIPPVSAVLHVYQLVNELGTLVSAHSCSVSNLTLYISLLKRFRQALTLLTSTCKLAILWVRDLQHKTGFSVCKTLHVLEQLQRTEESSQGILHVAFRVLQDEFLDLLIKNSRPIQLPSSLFSSGDEESDPLPQPVLPFDVVENLKAIVGACDSRCMSVYVEVRTTTVKTSLQGLDLGYLEISLSEFDSVQGIEGYIDDWGRHLEFVVKHVLEPEYTLCHQVFGQPDCFYNIAVRSGIQDFIKFGNTVTKAKKEAIKLFKLLDVFALLHNLRQDINRFFGGKHCSEIQTQTRNLIKKLVSGASDIFNELSAQVQLQRLMDPPTDGSLPRLVSFVTEYTEELLDDDYRPVLDQVLEIHSSWYNADRPVVSVEVHNIIKSLELNIETWAKRHENSALRCIFMMNASCYLSKHLKGTRLGYLMGESWLKRHDDCVEYYTQLYLKESWRKISTNYDGIKGFTEAFDHEYRKQSGWVLCDNSLRWKTGQMITGVIVPVYKRLIEGSGNKHVKYSSESLESMVTSMLQPKYGSNIKLMDRIKSVVVGRFSPTSTIAAA